MARSAVGGLAELRRLAASHCEVAELLGARMGLTEQVQAALAGQGVALARLALVFEALQRGELIEPFGIQARQVSPYAYWLAVLSSGKARPEVQRFCTWVLEQAALTRDAIQEDALISQPKPTPPLDP